MSKIYIVYSKDHDDVIFIKAFKDEIKANLFIQNQMHLNIEYSNYDYAKDTFLNSFPHSKSLYFYKKQKLDLEEYIGQIKDENTKNFNKSLLEKIDKSIKFLEENPKYHAQLEQEFISQHGLKPNCPDYYDNTFDIETVELEE